MVWSLTFKIEKLIFLKNTFCETVVGSLTSYVEKVIEKFFFKNPVCETVVWPLTSGCKISWEKNPVWQTVVWSLGLLNFVWLLAGWLNLLKIFRKFCEWLKTNAKFREVSAIFGALNLWNFCMKYYKTFIQKLKEKRKNILSYIVLDSCFHHVISFTFSLFGVSSLFHHTQHALCPNRQIFYSHLERKIWFGFSRSRMKISHFPSVRRSQVPKIFIYRLP